MTERYTDAAEMARAAGLPDGKSYRSRLRARLPEHHEPGTWRTVIGSAKHQAMQRELDAMLAERAH